MKIFRNTVLIVIVAWVLVWPGDLAAGWHADYIATLPTYSVRVVDADGQPVPGVSVGRGLRVFEADEGLLGSESGGTLQQWSWSEDGRTASVTDADGVALIRVAEQHVADGKKIAVYAWDTYGGRVALAEFGAEELNADGGVLEVTLQPGCRVSVGFVSSELEAQGVPLYDTMVYLSWGGHSILNLQSSTRHRASFFLPPGEYSLRMFGHGLGIPRPESGGAPTVEVGRVIEVEPGDGHLDLGTIDLPLSDRGMLVGKPAPPLGEMAGWINSEPLTLEKLRGKVVVLLFWSKDCPSSPYSAIYADLIRDRLGTEDFELIAIHEADTALTDAAAFERLARPALDAALAESWADNPPDDHPGELQIPIAIDTSPASDPGPGRTFDAYQADGWPTAIVIGRDGRVLHYLRHGVDEDALRLALEMDTDE